MLGKPHVIKIDKPQQMHVYNENQTHEFLLRPRILSLIPMCLLCLLQHRSFYPAEKSRMYRTLCLCVYGCMNVGVCVCLGGVGGFCFAHTCMHACMRERDRDRECVLICVNEGGGQRNHGHAENGSHGKAHCVLAMMHCLFVCLWLLTVLLLVFNADLSLVRFISAELTRGYFLEHNEAKYTERRERVYTCLRIPKELEKVGHS